MSKKLSKLHKPPSDLTKYDNEKYVNNPLLSFHLCDVNDRRHCRILKQKAAEEKIKLARRTIVDLEPLRPDFEKNHCNKLRHFVKTIPVPNILEKTLQKICDYVPERLVSKYPELVDGYITELSYEFKNLMTLFSVSKIVKRPALPDEDPSMYDISCEKFKFKFLGRTPNYSQFLKNKRRLEARLLLGLPFIRAIVVLSRIEFPDTLIEFDAFRGERDGLTLLTLNRLIKNDLENRTFFLRWSYYARIIAYTKKHYRKKTILGLSNWEKAYACMEGLINREINGLKIQTLDQLIAIILNPRKIPLLKFQLEYDVNNENIDLSPSIDDVVMAYNTISTLISDIATKMESLETQIDPFALHHQAERLAIGLNETYFEEYLQRLRTCLLVTYTPICEYLNGFRIKYFDIFSKKSREEIDTFLNEPRDFTVYLKKIEDYYQYITTLQSEPDKEFFDVAIIFNAPAIKKLRTIAQNLIERVIKQVVIEHMKEENEICKAFEKIRDKAMEIPKSTEELLSGAEYMIEVKTIKMAEMRERIQRCLRIGTEIVSLTEMSEEHINLTIKTISWLHEINEVLELNASQHEQYKFIFEEHLQDVIKKFLEDLQELIPKLAVVDDMNEWEEFCEYYIVFQNFMDQLTTFDDYLIWINSEEKLFKMQKTSVPTLEVIKEFVFPFASLLRECILWVRYYFFWMDGPFEYLVPKFVEETTDTFYKKFLATQKYYRNKIKQDLVGNPIVKFRGQTEDPDPEKHPVPLRLCSKMIKWIKEFQIGVTIVNIMCNPALRKRHWIEMSEIAGFDITPDAGTTLRKIVNYDLDKKLDGFEIISVGANKELQLQLSLYAMMKEWDTIEFPYGPYKETNVSILNNMDEIQALLDDHILKTLSMRGSAFMKPCEHEVIPWYDKLIRVNKTIEQWGKVQANFLYLLPIFSSKDIIAQMPEEGRLFSAVEQTFKRNMGMIMRNALVMETGPAAGLLESLDKAIDMLDDISNGVNNYLEKKRLYFSRFFFLSNDEMLEILSETKDPLRVQPHLSKCFEGIDNLQFDAKLNVLSMNSSDMENIKFVEMVSTSAAGGSVEKWLAGVESEMLRAVQNELELSFEDYLTKRRALWVLDWSQMVVLCISQVFWAVNVHEKLNSKSAAVMTAFFKDLNSDLNELVQLIRSKTISNLNRITIKSLIVIDVHAKDVTEDLIKMNVQSESDFQWLSQLRYYWEENIALVRIINATVPFANEYLGNSDRLVITPLTDRCYRTLVGAYQLHLNGAPEGPAGTGKTETTKDLAKALAVQCKVFNCSDGLDYKAMGKFFKGLASCGAWACFDEFNRIELEVLSVVAQQILSIIQAVRANLKKFMFEGTEINLNPACYVCITMNPGYAGRSELPDNLKVLFRSVAMMVPDYAMIGEISLYSFGFVNARILSVKIVTTYRLCSEQLSSQNHYDYGMRAVKTVLSACGNIKKAFPDENEDILLLRSLLDVNLPKFLSFDIPLFEGIISDLFPGIKLPETDYKLITREFKKICSEMNLQPKESFLTKVIQTFEMMIVRHGFMLVGEPMAGKTKTLEVLGKVLGKLKVTGASPYFQEVQMGISNPKSITMGQLYGAFDPVSYEWTDGIVATIFRNFAMDPSKDRKWVIFDGPVDAVWIENMNTVLDDNKKLCLTSGEVITMSGEMSMIFEVMDLSQASPATVSRCGMIYMEPSTLGWETFTDSWLATADERWQEDDGKQIVKNYLSWLLPPCQSFIRRNCSQLLKPGEFSVLRTTFDLFDMCLSEALEENPEEYSKFLIGWFQAALLYSISWGIGGILDIVSRQKFDGFLRKLFIGEDEANPMPEILPKIDISVPFEGLLVDYAYVFKQKGSWKYWPEVAKKMEIEITPSGVEVPTIDTARYIHILENHMKHKKKILFVGPTGTGKTAYVQNFLMNKISGEQFQSSFITFTVMISANQTQELLMSKLNKLKRGIYGPPKGKTAVLFVDDMNMPIKEVYGAQPPIELLRQFFDYGHWYDLKDTSKIFLKNVLILCACGLPGGSRQDVYARFLCHFNIFSLNTFSEETMNRIFVMVLLNGFKKSGHSNDVFLSAQQIVYATQGIYKIVQEGLRPTPAKSHYIFNLRDISRVVTGCALLRKESVENKKIFARLWYHEAMRVFYDRLVEESDQLWMFSRLNECIKEHFREKVETLFDAYCEQDGRLTLEGVNRLIFGTYLDEDNEPEEKRYEEIESMDVLMRVAYLNLEEYNSTRRNKMDIVLFFYALQHLNKICRIMSIQGGCALLVGIGGSGRQSLTKLAATMSQTLFFQPEITKNYGVNDWHNDIKNVLKQAGGYGKHTAFLMTENQIKMELFLQDIDCLLNQGEVPNIFAIDEKQEVLEIVRLAAQGGNRNIDISPLQVFSFFVNRCKQKMHIILCFSPIGSALRTRIRLYPSLVNCCTIDWFQIWPKEALEMVAQRYMDNVQVIPEVKASAVLACQHFHLTANETIIEFYQQTGRIIYITSASFLELIKSFESLVNRKQKEIMEQKMRYIGGLDTLANAASAIGEMQKELNALQPKLVQLAENSRKMMVEINKETIAASAAAEQVKKDEVIASAQAESAQVLKNECEKDLAKAIPVLEDAISALNTLKPADITLVKSMKNPPPVVKLVMAAVCVIKGVPADRVNDPGGSGKMVQDYWGPSKRLLGDMYFLQLLKDFDKDNINPEVMKKIRKEYIPHKDFQPRIVAKASSAAEGLCKWIIAMDLYDNVAKVVAPKKAKLAEAEKEYADTMKILNEKREMAEALERKVAKLNEDLERANAEMQRTQEEADFCQNKLMRAEALIGGLGGEKSRWTQTAIYLQSVYDNLPGDILISCGVIAYLSTLTAPFRIKCIDDWFLKVVNLKIPCSKVYSIVNTLGSEITIQSWNLFGLPLDAFSIENAIIMDSSSRYTLFIDPQNQANQWIKNMERTNRLSVVKFSQGNYMKIIEAALEHGSPVLIESILEELEVPLNPILSKNTFFQGGQLFMSLGDNIVPCSPKFRLYMTSTLRNPHFLPETYNQVTIVNFALTQRGLEDQLLSIVVAKERPDLQEMRQVLITDAARNKAQLKEAEDLILKTLEISGKSILENESAIQILDESKKLSVDIMSKQVASRETEIVIEKFRANYKSVATHSSILYYSITDLPNIDPMYQFSLNWYISLYVSSIENANKSKDLDKRLRFLIEMITFNLYSNVCRSIFEKDKLLYSFILTTKILISENSIDPVNLLFLLAGGSGSNKDEPNPNPNWITPAMWEAIKNLEEVKQLSGFVSSFKSSLKNWQAYYDHNSPQTEPLPEPWNTKVKRFEKIIILKAFRPDKVFMAISNFIVEEMGQKFVSPPPFDIAKSFGESNCLNPLIFILSPGADPMGSLLLFAEKMGYDDTFQSISLGQGQGPIAHRMIKEAQDTGLWVCLQNCHLAASWMPTLEHLWENMDAFNTETNFRLWLTSYPSDRFPVAMLQNGVKMTNEPPTGLQQNLIRSYNSEPMSDEKFYTGCPNQDRAFTRLLFGICFFHAVVQERRKFGPLGWNIQYGFNESDFQISVQQLAMLLNQYDHVPFAAISYLTAECNYGGRVTDAWDRRAIVTILSDYVNAEVVENPRYSFADDDIYILPRKSEHREVVRYISETIPTLPPPEVYGLHSNAGITRDLQTTNLMLDSMTLTVGKTSSDSGGDTENVLLETIKQIAKSLPKDFDIETVKQKYPVDYNESMNTVLVQEMERFMKLLKEIRITCSDLLKAIDGSIVMTPELEDVIQSINFKKIPKRWMSKSYPSLKPLGSYVLDFVERLKWLQRWYDIGKPPTFWISGFYFTQAFLTGAMQNYARKYKIPIDTLTFDFHLLKVAKLDNPPVDGVYINGIFIEGSRFDWSLGYLEEQVPKILLNDMPAIHVIPILVVELFEGKRYKCPLYKTAERKGTLSTTGHSTNYVLPILLSTLKPAAHWVKRSTALICQTSE